MKRLIHSFVHVINASIGKCKICNGEDICSNEVMNENDKENNSETDKNNTSDKLLNEQDTNCSVVENYIV